MSDSAKYLIEQDLLRYGRKKKFGIGVFLRYVFIEIIPGIKFSIIFRLCQHYRYKNKLLFYFYFVWLRRLKYKYGFDISYRTQIGKGLYIGHFGGIVIHGDAEIGENCNLSQGMTIGVLNRGRIGIPKIGNRVFIAPNAVILGGITIGSDVLVGANAVVTFDVPDRAVVAAPQPGIISYAGTQGYIQTSETIHHEE
jgi:serine O-acetyltransferase